MNSMAVSTEFSTTLCNHCDRDIPAPNFDLHYAHCIRNLEKCRICGDMVPKKHSEEHYLNTHAPVSCSLCSETVEREVLTLHKGERCPQRIVTCEYCEFPLPVVDLFKHQEVCGNRTEYCEICCKYVRLRERLDHERQFHSGTPGVPAEPSRTQYLAIVWAVICYDLYLVHSFHRKLDDIDTGSRSDFKGLRKSLVPSHIWMACAERAKAIDGALLKREILVGDVHARIGDVCENFDFIIVDGLECDRVLGMAFIAKIGPIFVSKESVATLGEK
ncbi:hypothetical protein AMTR_s00046p00200010 [Amborella trichopoda]|uniref:TRAF-type domain-containing protein n=1 Tax=Amborella trichopoda TaxID=13333 RepID=U5CXL4_AMBTC|nr:hypothetical protein AMTR_s00046p00200010 [Amborella trichopoda]